MTDFDKAHEAWLRMHLDRRSGEIKGFVAHVEQMDRKKYSEELNRETFLRGLGYQVISISYDDVEKRPDMIISLLRMVLGRYMPEQRRIDGFGSIRQEIVRLAAGMRAGSDHWTWSGACP